MGRSGGREESNFHKRKRERVSRRKEGKKSQKRRRGE